MPPAPRIDFGTCCQCGGADDVMTILLLDFVGPTPGRGWGCVQCKLPTDGAVAMLCLGCADDLRKRQIAGERALPIFVAAGADLKARVPISALDTSRHHDHDLALHPECPRCTDQDRLRHRQAWR